MKQCCPALVVSGTSTRDDTDNIFGKADKNLDDLDFSWIYWEGRGGLVAKVNARILEGNAGDPRSGQKPSSQGLGNGYSIFH